MEDILSVPPSIPSRLGLGCVTFGREIDRENSFVMMDHALEHEITFFDTAAAYGGGASERIIGAWMASRGARTRVSLGTKIVPPYSAAIIEEGIAGSLERLNAANVDVLYLHRWDESAVDATVLRSLDSVVRSGRVRALGVSNFTVAQLGQVLDLQAELGTTPIRALQNIHNLAVRSIDDPTLQLCARHQIAIVGYSPLGAGFLTGKHDQGVQPGSRFDIVPGHQNVYFNDLARRRLSRLRDIATRTGFSMTQLALAWALHQPGIAAVLAGGRTTAHLDQVLAARAFSAPELLREIAAK
jgi:1-deoxyxylulose-5-phosphate synthase